MTAPTVIGLDVSLTSTGVASSLGWTTRIRRPGRGHQRLASIVDEIRTHTQNADLIVIEGPSYGSTGSSYHQLAGLWWIVTHSLWHAQRPVAVVSPQARAKYATGRGNAGKDEVLAAVVRRYPQVDVCGNDEADAWVLAAMGADWLGHPLAQVPATHRAALDKVDWPDLLTPAA